MAKVKDTSESHFRLVQGIVITSPMRRRVSKSTAQACSCRFKHAENGVNANRPMMRMCVMPKTKIASTNNNDMRQCKCKNCQYKRMNIQKGTCPNRGVRRLNQPCGKAFSVRRSGGCGDETVLVTDIFQDFKVCSENWRVWRNFFQHVDGAC